MTESYRDATVARLVKQAEVELENIWPGLSLGNHTDKQTRGVIARTIVYGVAAPAVDEALGGTDREAPLSREELRVMDDLVRATQRFTALPEHHPADMGEWVHHVHALQNMVMARAAVRTVPHYPWTPLVRHTEGPPSVDTSAREST